MEQNVFYTNSDGSLPTFPRPAKEQGQFVKIAVNPTTHRLLVDSTGGGGGGGGDASAANQVTGNNSLSSIDGKTTTVNSNLTTLNSTVGTGNASLASIDGKTSTVNTNLGTLNTSVGTGNSSLSSIDTKTSTVNTNLGTINTSIGTTNSSLSTVNTNIGTTNTSLGTVNTNLGTVITSLGDVNVTGAATQTVAGNNVVLASAGTAAYDANGSRSVSIQIVPTGTVSSGVVTFEASQDNVNFVALPLYDEASLTANPISTVSPSTGVFRFFTGPVTWRYFRARISTVIGGGGSIQAFTRFSPSSFNPDQYTVTQATGANLNVAVASGTVTTVTTLTTLANGQTAHSSASTGSPVRVAGRVNTTLDTSLVQGDASDLFISTAGQLVEKPFSTAENDWQYATPIASPIVNTTAVVLKAAGAASIRNYVTALQYHNSSAVASIITVQDNVTVIWTGYAPASMTVPVTVVFPTPLRGTAATAMNFVVNTTATSTLVSAQGYQSF